MADNITGANGPVTSFRSIGTMLHEANQKVGIKQDAGTLNALELRKLKDSGGFGILGASKLLTDLADAEAAIGADPLVRYKWIEKMLEELATVEHIDPNVALRFVSLARAKHMPDGTTETRPFIVDFERFDEACKHVKEQGLPESVRPIGIPLTHFTDRGHLRMSGTRFCVPNGRAELDSFFRIRKILELVARSAEAVLYDNSLFNLEIVAEWLVRSLPRAQFVSTDRLKDKRAFKPAGDGLYKLPYGKEVLFRACAISDASHLLLLDNKRNRTLIDRIQEIRKNNALLKRDELAIDVAIVRQLRADDGRSVVTPRDFLAGQPGKIAVRYEWRHGEKRSDVYLMFERRNDGMWRVLFYNNAAARELLASRGMELRFTWFSETEVPNHLVKVLRQGKAITGPEDFGLTEEDVAMPSGEPDASE